MFTNKDHEQAELADCRAGVMAVLQQNDWRLLAADQLTICVEEALHSGTFADARKAAVHVYCHTLFAACRGDEGPQRQERAFAELQRYLYRLSFRLAPELPPDARQELIGDAVLRIWQRFPSYRKPGAFLAIVALELRSTLRPWNLRARPRGQGRAWELPPTSIDAAHEELASALDCDPVALTLDRELARHVRACFAEALRRHPRARQQLASVWLKYIVGLDDATISRYLAKPVSSVHVLRSRGLRCLRAQSSWQLLAQDLAA